MDDIISRQAAIDAVCMEWCGVKHQDCKHPFDAEKDDYYWCDGCETALRTLPDLPSAETEKVCIAKITLSEEQIREAVEKAKSEIVQVLPSAEPRPKGRWISMSDIDGDYYCCSQCGGELPRYSLSTPTWDDPYTYLQSIDETNFCPNCGADMREETQDD